MSFGEIDIGLLPNHGCDNPSKTIGAIKGLYITSAWFKHLLQGKDRFKVMKF